MDAAVEAGDRDIEASALHSWGDYLFNAGQLEDSLAKLERAAAAYEAAGNRVALGTVFNSLGRLYRAHGRLDEALAFQMKALALHEREQAGFELMQSLNAVGAVQSMLGHTAVARELLRARAGARGEVFVAADSGLPSRQHRGTLDRRGTVRARRRASSKESSRAGSMPFPACGTPGSPMRI